MSSSGNEGIMIKQVVKTVQNQGASTGGRSILDSESRSINGRKELLDSKSRSINGRSRMETPTLQRSQNMFGNTNIEWTGQQQKYWTTASNVFQDAC